MEFLLTGGEGFIGRNLKEALVSDNHTVMTLDTEGNPDYKVSILNLRALQRAFKGVDRVFHFAARTSPPQFEFDLLQGFKTNVIGTLNVLKAAADNGVKRVVLASSSATYGSMVSPGKEDMPIYGHDNMYATTKLFDEYLGRYYTIRNELEVISLRLFNTYGIGENSKGLYSSVISKFLEAVLHKEDPVIYDEGKQSRDFIYVKDVATASIAAMQNGIPGENYNVGTGHTYSFNEIIKEISEALNVKIIPKYAKNPFKNYQMFTQADIGKSFRDLNWKPQYDLKKGIVEIAEAIGLL